MRFALPYHLMLGSPCPGLLCCCSPFRADKPVLGVIGCMAERLKSRLFEEKAVDIIAGPDALRSVPGLVDLFCKVGTSGDDLIWEPLFPHAALGPHDEQREALRP